MWRVVRTTVTHGSSPQVTETGRSRIVGDAVDAWSADVGVVFGMGLAWEADGARDFVVGGQTTSVRLGHSAGENICGYPAPLTSLERRVSELVDGDARPRAHGRSLSLSEELSVLI